MHISKSGFKFDVSTMRSGSTFVLPVIEVGSDLGDKILHSTVIIFAWLRRLAVIEYGSGDFSRDYDPIGNRTAY